MVTLDERVSSIEAMQKDESSDLKTIRRDVLDLGSDMIHVKADIAKILEWTQKQG